jgi:hypothetical protein
VNSWPAASWRRGKGSKIGESVLRVEEEGKGDEAEEEEGKEGKEEVVGEEGAVSLAGVLRGDFSSALIRR